MVVACDTVTFTTFAFPITSISTFKIHTMSNNCTLNARKLWRTKRLPNALFRKLHVSHLLHLLQPLLQEAILLFFEFYALVLHINRRLSKPHEVPQPAFFSTLLRLAQEGYSAWGSFGRQSHFPQVAL